MADVIDSLTRGNATEVKVVLASIAAAAAVYQLVLIAVGYGKLKPSFLSGKAASRAHRAAGDTILVLLVVTAFICIAYFGYGYDEDDATFHIVVGSALLVVLALKVAVIRWLHGLGRFLPLLGIGVFVLLTMTWWSSAAEFLWGD